MADNLNDQADGNSTPPRPVRDKVTKDKIDKHLRDKDDTISEQDIKNISTTLTAKDLSAEQDADEVSAEPEGEREDTSSKPEMPNTWDLVD
jgi:hypothetical protein